VFLFQIMVIVAAIEPFKVIAERGSGGSHHGFRHVMELVLSTANAS
jgi:hypothetical protein